MPKKTTCSSFHNSRSNLKKHIQQLYLALQKKYDDLIRSQKKKAEDSTNGPHEKIYQLSMTTSMVGVSHVSQGAVDDAILDPVVGGVLSLNFVELQEFETFVHLLQPIQHATSCQALKENIIKKDNDLKAQLANELQQ